MADIITTSYNLKIESLFVDGDTRTQTLKNPRADITTADIQNLESFMRANNIIKGDKYGGTFGRIQTVKRVSETRTKLDFS